MPFSTGNLNNATLPLEINTAISLQEGGGPKLTIRAGDESSTECDDIGGGTTMCFIGVNKTFARKSNGKNLSNFW